MHAAFLGLTAAVAWQSTTVLGVDRRSLLYTVISGEEVTEGPLDPSAYAQTEGPGVGGARLAALDIADTSLDPITFEDAEVNFSEHLGGTAVLAPLQPLVAQPGSETAGAATKPFIYTIEDGDTVAGIAARFNISDNTVLWANGLSSRNILKVGDHLTILPTTGVQHTVSDGNTLSWIAQHYDVSSRSIIEYNTLPNDGADLHIGQKLMIPDGVITPASTPRIAPRGEVASLEPAPEGVTSPDSGFLWPTTSRHISQGFKWGHTGIDLDNRSRPAIYAAEAGTVEFTGWLGGYGNLIIVNHGKGLTTHYAHVDKFYTSKGSSVAKGDAIAQMGSTGRSSGPHLHFEVRQNGRPVNPLGMY